jgi:glycogen debranching enzyme
MVHGTLVALADVEELARHAERAAEYRRMAEDLRQAIQKHLWSEELGFFIDRRPDGSVSDYIGIGGFITGLFANHVYRPGGVATGEQAERLAAWCSHPDFASDFGTLCLARSSPYYDAADYKGYNSNFDMHWSNQVPAGLYAHGCYEEAHRQLAKLFRRLGENAGLGPHYRGECYHADTGEILPRRFVNYGCILSALSSVLEGVFGIRWTKDALTAHVNAPWPWAKLSNVRIRKSLLDLELTADGSLVARIDGKEVARSADRKAELPWDLFA